MFQEFFKDTLMGRFIKRLLRTEKLPLLPFIKKGDNMLLNQSYIYNNLIVQCVEAGVFEIYDEDHPYPSHNIYPSRHRLPAIRNANGEFIGGALIQARYRVISNYDPNDESLHTSYHSKFMYYDSETHERLGDYLRYLRDYKGLNLLPYYNCYSSREASDLIIDADGKVRPGTNKNNKILLVPVKFATAYTIALDSDSPIRIHTILYNPISGLCIKSREGTHIDYYSDDLDDAVLIKSNSSFIKPFTITTQKANNCELFNQENNLYLMIEINKSNTSALTVLEGNYTDSWSNARVNFEYMHSTSNFNLRLALLHFNSQTSFAFSDRLIEYLLLGVIHKDDALDGNIKYFQNLVKNKIKSTYLDTHVYGVWDDSLKVELYNFIKDKTIIRDFNGNLDKDSECLLNN